MKKFLVKTVYGIRKLIVWNHCLHMYRSKNDKYLFMNFAPMKRCMSWLTT